MLGGGQHSHQQFDQHTEQTHHRSCCWFGGYWAKLDQRTAGRTGKPIFCRVARRRSTPFTFSDRVLDAGRLEEGDQSEAILNFEKWLEAKVPACSTLQVACQVFESSLPHCTHWTLTGLQSAEQILIFLQKADSQNFWKRFVTFQLEFLLCCCCCCLSQKIRMAISRKRKELGEVIRAMPERKHSFFQEVFPYIVTHFEQSAAHLMPKERFP